MVTPVYPATNNAEAIDLNISNANQFFAVLQGDIDATIPTYEGFGRIPSVSKALNEAAAYRIPLPWETSGEELDLLQPRDYLGNTYVPRTVPAPFSTTPDGDYWRLYSPKDLASFFATSKETFIATQGQQVFNLTSSSYTPNANNVAVFIQGVRQTSSDFLETSPTQVTLTEPLNSGEVVEIITNKILEASTLSASDYAEQAQISAADAQNSATVASSAETAAVAAKNSAELAETNAEASASAALSSENSAASSASNAATAASNASASETAAIAAKDLAETAASNAATSEANAATSEANAATSATNSLSSENAAAISASDALTSASNAATFEANALLYAQQAEDAASLAAGVFVSDSTQTGELATNTVWLVDSTAQRIRSLPALPSQDAEIKIVDNTGTASVNNATIERNGNTIMGLSEDLTIDIDRARFSLKYVSGDWRIV